MAVLSDGDRLDCWAELMRDFSSAAESLGITKADFRAAIDAADTWVNSNAASFNSAIPQPARGAMTASQKVRLLAAVALKRFVKGA